jgi:hypothetical protein
MTTNRDITWPRSVEADFASLNDVGREAWDSTPPSGRTLMLDAMEDLLDKVGLIPTPANCKAFALGVVCGPALAIEGLAPFIVAACLARADGWPIVD